MSSNITLSAAVRSNLLSLQNTASLLDTTQTRLATGNKVNSALDNPTSYFTATGLNSRASDLGNLLDSVSNAIQTIQAANDGITSITKLVESAQATANQALQLQATLTTTAGASAGTLTGGAFTALNVSGAGSAASHGVVTAGTFAAVNVAGAGSSPSHGTLSSSGFTALNLGATAQTATQSTITAGGTYTNIDLSNNADNTLSFDVTLGASTHTITLDNSGGTGGVYDIDQAITAIQGQLTTAGLAVTVGKDLAGTSLTFTANAAGATALTVGNAAAAGTGVIAATTDLGITNASTTGQTNTGLANVTADSVSFSLTVGSATHTITLDHSTTASNHAAVTAAEVATAINAQFGSSVADGTSGQIVFTDPATGTASHVQIASFAATGNATTSGIANGNNLGSAGTTADSLSFTVNVNGAGAQTVTLSSAAITTYNGAHSSATVNAASLSAADVAAVANSQLSSSVVTVSSGGALVFTSGSVGTASTVAVSAVTAAGSATNTTGITADNQAGAALVPADSVSFSLSVDGTAHTINLDAAHITTYNTAHSSATVTASALSAADVAAVINDQFGSTVASVTSGGALALTSGTTGTSSNVTVTTFAATGAATTSGLANGNNTGAVTSTTSTPNPARAALVTQYNGLLDQIDQLTSDAGYNGNNLLSGTTSQLKVVFNETGTSSLTISGKDTSATGLGLAKLTVGTEFNTNASITSILGNLKTAQDTLRSDASSFGSNLSIVQTRQDFTKALINTLQTGASNLTLADSNEEAANLLALQTRQSLSTKALSLASQSDQNVLRLLQ